MPKLVNNNAHPIRPVGPDGSTLARILPGQVVDASGAYADRLSACAGVGTASKDDVDRWDRSLDAQRTRGAMPGDGSRLSAKMALGPAREAVRHATVVAPLQRVVGDDSAPQGPPSGTVTTKADATSSGKPADVQAFAQGEEMAVLGKKVEANDTATNHTIVTGQATQGDIHNKQTDNRAAADEAARAFIGSSASAPAGSGDPIEGEYDDFTSAELSGELSRRGLDDEPNKPAKVAALKADDAKQASTDDKPASSTPEGSGS